MKGDQVGQGDVEGGVEDTRRGEMEGLGVHKSGLVVANRGTTSEGPVKINNNSS